MNKLTVSIPEAAKRLGIHKNTAYRLAQEGKLPAMRIGKRIMVPIAKLEELLSCRYKI
jgi:excisionase family DNA binding protein